MADEPLTAVFPLSVVLLPGMPLPLHIFEERYKLMIGRCLEDKSEFGVVLQEQDRMRSVGCTAAIRRVLRRYPDGRLDILSVGVRRFRILELRDDGPYLQAAVEPLLDSPEGPGAGSSGLVAQGIRLLERLASLLGRSIDSAGLRKLAAEDISFHLAATDGFSLQERQELLEMTSTEDRLARAVGALEQILERLQHSVETHRLIGGNGHVREAFRG